MDIIKGQNLRITIGGSCVAFATSCTVHVSKQLEETSTKDSTGSWTEQEVVGKSWDISVDALYGVSSTPLTQILGSDSTVAIQFANTSGTNNQVIGDVVVSGTAIINDLSVNATNKQNVSYTLQAQGVGELSTT